MLMETLTQLSLEIEGIRIHKRDKVESQLIKLAFKMHF